MRRYVEGIMGTSKQWPVRQRGYRFGDWVVVDVQVDVQVGARYVCECPCGRRQNFPGPSNLELGKSASCVTCANRAIHVENSIRGSVGMSQEHVDRLSNRYYAIKRRCENPEDRRFPGYGGRGIRCLFADREAFLRHVKTLPGWDIPELEIDRIDNDGDYRPGNIRLATRREQTRNTRQNQCVVYRGERVTAVEFWERYAPRYRGKGTVARKIRQGIPPEQIIEDQNRCRGPYLRHT